MNVVKSERGYTLIEAIAFMGVLTMLAVSVVFLVNRMLDRYRVSRVGNQIMELQKNIDYRFSSSENFDELTLDELIDDHLVPADMLRGEDMFHAYSREAEVKSTRGGLAYSIEFKQLPLSACLELALIDWSVGHTSNLMSIRLNNTYFDWKGASSQLPIDILTAQNLCTAGDTSNNILWQFQ